jgi:hypothetical protein
VAKKPTAADEQSRAEALRIHGRIQEQLASGIANIREHVHASLQHNYPSGAGSRVLRFGQTCLSAGMAWYRLHGDAKQAHTAFAEAKRCVPLLYEVESWLARVGPGGYRGAPFGAHPMLYLLPPIMFSSDRASAEEVARCYAANELQAEEIATVLDQWPQLVMQILRCEVAADLVRTIDQVEPNYKKGHVTHYCKPLAAIARGDGDAFRSYVPGLAEAFRARRRLQDAALEYGNTKLGQIMAFDFLGAALIRLANWRGISVEVDTEVHPGIFSCDGAITGRRAT